MNLSQSSPAIPLPDKTDQLRHAFRHILGLLALTALAAWLSSTIHRGSGLGNDGLVYAYAALLTLCVFYPLHRLRKPRAEAVVLLLFACMTGWVYAYRIVDLSFEGALWLSAFLAAMAAVSTAIAWRGSMPETPGPNRRQKIPILALAVIVPNALNDLFVRSHAVHLTLVAAIFLLFLSTLPSVARQAIRDNETSPTHAVQAIYLHLVFFSVFLYYSMLPYA